MVEVHDPTSTEVADAAASNTLLNRMQNGRTLKTVGTEMTLSQPFSSSFTGLFIQPEPIPTIHSYK